MLGRKTSYKGFSGHWPFRAVVSPQRRRGYPVAHGLIAFAAGCAITASVPCPANAQSGKLEASYVVIGGDGAVARAVLTGTPRCPAITIDTQSGPMSVRARPDDDPAFPVLVCEKAIASDANVATIAGRNLPLPRRARAVAVLGDTGCRLKAAKNGAAKDHDHPYAGKFQDCDRPSQWPFGRLSESVAARKPDLVVHVGDYVYRESPCPPSDRGCAGSPSGDNWPTWQAEFFAPAAALLAAAPWIMVRGNHETCERAGAGFFRFLDPALAVNETVPVCSAISAPYTARVGGKTFIVMDSSNASDYCPNGRCDSAPYAEQFAGLKPAPSALLITHRPIWAASQKYTLNATLQQALATSRGRLPEEIALVLAGHMHIFELLSFADRRPPLLVVGTGGTALDEPIKRRLVGMSIGGATVRRARVDRAFGFVVLRARAGNQDWTATFYTAKGRPKFACKLTSTAAICGDSKQRTSK